MLFFRRVSEKPKKSQPRELGVCTDNLPDMALQSRTLEQGIGGESAWLC